MRARVLLSFPAAALALSCGYHPIHGGDAAREKLRVELGTIAIADAVAADEVAAGAREALSREGALGSSGDPKLVIEVTRIDETADAILAPHGTPRAGAVVVAVVGRGSVYDAHSERLRDTGDVRATELVQTPAEARADAFVHESAVRAAARRLGRKIALRAIGDPISSEDGEGRAP